LIALAVRPVPFGTFGAEANIRSSRPSACACKYKERGFQILGTHPRTLLSDTRCPKPGTRNPDLDKSFMRPVPFGTFGAHANIRSSSPSACACKETPVSQSPESFVGNKAPKLTDAYREPPSPHSLSFRYRPSPEFVRIPGARNLDPKSGTRKTHP